MLTNHQHVSLADLAGAGLRLKPVEAVTVAREVALQVARGELPGVPSAHVIRFTDTGEILLEGPVPAGGPGVSRAAQLLDALLPGFDAPPEFRVPGALRLIVARALGTLDLPPYPSLENFATALERFGAPGTTTVVRDLVASWAAASVQTSPRAAAVAVDQAASDAPASEDNAQPAENSGVLTRMQPVASQLTISDIRRARRATGLTLADISERSRIPAWLLRELEWGYFRNWPAGHYGRTQLVRYARASGLDDQVVVRTLWPMIDRDARIDGADIVPAMEWTESPDWDSAVLQKQAPAQPAWETRDEPIVVTVTPVPSREHQRRNRILAALAIPALLAIGFIPALLQQSSEPEETGQEVQVRSTAPAQPVQRGDGAAAPAAAAVPPPATEQVAAGTAGTAGPAALPAAQPELARADLGDPTLGQPRPASGISEGTAFSPAFATTGTAMFYHAESGGQSALMRADTDSRGAVLRVTSVVDDNARNFHARPSPDGSMIAFDSDREGERAVFVASADGKNVRRVSTEGFAAIPSWSPDGRTLAYVRAEPGKPKVWNLWTTDLETGEAKKLTSYKFGQPWGGSWFPDGRRIAYSHETRLIVRDIQTGRERIYNSPVKGRLVRTPAVSPDGRRVMFQVFRDGAWLLDLNDNSMRKVLSDPSAEEYTWAPDGGRVAYHSRRTGSWGVWVMASR